jgi:uncharacterized membrane protein
MNTDKGLQRLVSFSDAVVAIAITLLILPLVDAASSYRSVGLRHFLDGNSTRLLAFALSFAVIGSFWWGQHQRFEGIKAYNSFLVWAMFLWLISIVFLPFPTELIGVSRGDSVAVHGLYVGTMVVTALAALFQQWVIVRWPALQDEKGRGSATLVPALVGTVLLILAFVVVITAPSIGLWALLLLLLSRPLEALLRGRRKPLPAA